MATTNPAWSPNLQVAIGFVIIDPNGNVQQAITPGLTGLQPPTFAALNRGAVTSDGGQVKWILVAILAPPTLPAFPLPALPMPSFVNDADGLDPNLVLADQIAEFEAITGRTLYPAQVERLYINGSSYREVLARNAIQEAGEGEMLAFARFPILDYLGALLGVLRLPVQPATTTIQVNLVNALSVPFPVPGGTQVGTADGQFQFATDAALTIPAGASNGSVTATLVLTTNIVAANANGYLPGSVNVLLNPNALIASVSNLATTANGAPVETDDHLRARIQLASNTFTTAGPTKQYRALALGVSPTIIDAEVTSPQPGTVNVYILTGPINNQPAANPNSAGIASGGLIAQVLAALSADTVRPLTDTVNVFAVTEVDYNITATVELYSDANPTAVQAAVNQAAILFANNLASRGRRDQVPEEIGAALTVVGVYRVVVTSPSYLQLTPGQWSNCTAIALTFTTSTEHS
jgi:phage-related baseplate assembly protein